MSFFIISIITRNKMMDKDINDEIENQKFVNELFNKKIT